MNKFAKNLEDQLYNTQAIPGVNNSIDPGMSQQEYMDQADAPLFVAPNELQRTEIADIENKPVDKSNYMKPAMEEANDQPGNEMINGVEIMREGEAGPGRVESGAETPESFAALRKASEEKQAALPTLPANNVPEVKLTPQEQLLEEFRKMRESDEARLERARASDRMAKFGGDIGDALATYVNAQGQKNVKAPGVQIQKGAGLADMVKSSMRAPDVEKDALRRREDLLANLKGLKDTEGMSPYQELMYNLRLGELDFRKEKEGGVNNRHKEGLDWNKEKANRLSDKQEDTISNYDQTLASLFRTKDLKSGVETGPIPDYRNMVAAKLGIDDPKVTALRAQTIDTLAERVKALSGTASSNAERAVLGFTLPAMGDSHETFLKKLENAETRIKEAREIRLKSYAKQGKNVETFQEQSRPDSQTDNTPDKDSVFLKANPKATYGEYYKDYKWNPATETYQKIK